jgi:hypothetical protein
MSGDLSENFRGCFRPVGRLGNSAIKTAIERVRIQWGNNRQIQ